MNSSKLLTCEEAQNVIDAGGIVKGGGYTYAKNIYFAYGTYPGCKRGGDITCLGHHNQSWVKVSEKDIVCLIGYYPCEYSREYNDGTVPFQELWNFLKENLDNELLKNPFINSKICKIFFENEENK